jgi:hypothetical protein
VLPLFLGELYKEVFEKEGELRQDASITAIVAIRQVYLGLKKLELPCKERSIQDAVQEFLDIEPTLRRPTLQWGLPDLNHHSNVTFCDDYYVRYGSEGFYAGLDDSIKDRAEECLLGSLTILHRVCDIVSALLGDLHSEVDTELPKHGPGAVSNLRRGEDKYSFPQWSERLEAIFPYCRYAAANEGLLHEDSRDLSGAENSSRLICVPKTLKAPRLIAAEPVENQWLQQLVRNQLESRLKKTPLSSSVAFNDQSLNQKGALYGSENGCYATIDLSSASDRLSCWTVERVFRNNASILERLNAVRSSKVEGKLLKEPLELAKHSTMGSAVTFTVQSIVYACVSIAAVLAFSGKKVTIKSIREATDDVQVFGDDIIVPTEVVHLVADILKYLDLKVNWDKTYTGRHFRESCGVDAFAGHDVSPVYTKHLPSTNVTDGKVSSIVQTSNNLHNKGYWTLASLFKESLMEQDNLIPVVSHTSGLFGYTSFTGFVEPRYWRWNDKLHKVEYKVLQPVKKVDHIERDNHTNLLQYFLEAPDPLQAKASWHAGYKRYGRVLLRVGWHSLESVQ